MPTLFDPLVAGALALNNRVVMAPLTRTRATPDGRVPVAVVAEYYRQRASAGLILSEATSVDPMGVGYPRTPGIWSDEQVEGWKPVTQAVHAAGGKIVLQLWHVGRISDPELLSGATPVSASAIKPAGRVALLRPKREYVTPRALELAEIPGVIAAYKKGAANAKAAGFDGVEVHGANGYLLDQFLRDKTNHRQDAYGGGIENRARLMLEVVDAVSEVWGPQRVGLHISPKGSDNDMADSDPRATFSYVAREVGKRGIAFLFVREAQSDDYLLPQLKDAFGGVVIANDGLNQAAAEHLLAQGTADAVSFGRDYIANPDLVERLRTHAPLNPLDPATLHAPIAGGDDAHGYTDYPTL